MVYSARHQSCFLPSDGDADTRPHDATGTHCDWQPAGRPRSDAVLPSAHPDGRAGRATVCMVHGCRVLLQIPVCWTIASA